MKLVVKFPTRGRPGKAVPLLERYRDMRSRRHEVYFVVTIDADDRTMNNGAVTKSLAHLGDRNPGVCCAYRVGASKTKVQAINADMNLAPPGWDVLLLASDDMVPQVAAYDAIIFEHMNSHFPDLDGCLWFNDGYSGQKLCTLVVMGRKYYERFGYIYPPAYTSLWCDNEWTEVAQALNRIRYVDCTIIKHEHPANSRTAAKDALYQRNEGYFYQDSAIYQARKANGFYLGNGGIGAP